MLTLSALSMTRSHRLNPKVAGGMACLCIVRLASAQLAVTADCQTGPAPFTPSWKVDQAHSLLKGLVPATAGDFGLNGPRANAASLTTNENLTLSVTGGVQNPNYVMAGNGYSAGSELVYTLAKSGNGFDLGNITVYSGWNDKGRHSQAYVVYCTTSADPAHFRYLTAVNYSPSVSGDPATANQIIIRDESDGPIASNVYSLKFVFSSPPSAGVPNYYSGYAAITAGGKPSAGPAPATPPVAATAESPDLELEGSARALVGNGRSVVIATPDGFHYHRGAGGDGKLHLSKGSQPVELGRLYWKTTAFPGGVVFSHRTKAGAIEILHTALPDDPYGVVIRCSGEFTGSTVSIEGGPAFKSGSAAAGEQGFSETGVIAAGGFDALRAKALAPYTGQGMVLHSPDHLLDQAVQFNQYLLDLSYNGNLIVCELFRWADIWSRDLGSGFVPGAIFTGRLDAARKCIDVDLARHEKATAKALKTTGDASQGGSAEGVGHLTTALWDYYLLTGDRAYLARVAEGIRPWVDAWLARDYANIGLIIDTTDWMDHSRYEMLPFGSRTLYANAQMVRLLGTFTKIEHELGDTAGETRYAGSRDRFITAINGRLWSEKLGCYGNLLLNGQIDERSASAANSLALLGGVADPSRAARVLASLKDKNWRPSGTLTITPLMTYHPDNDQNEKIWPWWVAYEAMARFRNGDPGGGLRLLDNCAATIRNPTYPGMMDETMNREGHSEGGRAFATAAGSLLTSIYKGLFGIEILAGGMREVRIMPNLPAGWKDASLRVPTPGGSILVEVREGVTRVTVNDTNVKTIHTTANAVVNGAEKKVWAAPSATPAPRTGEAVMPPPLVARGNAVYLDEPGLPGAPPLPADARYPRIGAQELAKLDPSRTHAVVIRGNSLPFSTKDGQPIQAALDRYLAGGGMLVFQGATMRPNKSMGEEAGLIEWYGQENGAWVPVHPRTGKKENSPKRDGTIYHGDGHYFGGWDAGQGIFGFQASGQGIHRKGPAVPGLTESPATPVSAVFTDFAVSSPWYFQPLATTHTTYNFLIPAQGEDFPCVARLVNRETHGEILLIAKGAESSVDLGRLLQGR